MFKKSLFQNFFLAPKKMKVKWILVQNEWFEKKVVNDDLFKRKSVVVNFWCFLQSWCISLEKKTSSSWREFLEMPVNLKILSKKQIITSFLLLNIGKPKKIVLCLLLCFAFSTIDYKLKMHFCFRSSKQLFALYWNWYQLQQKMQKNTCTISDI